MLENFLNNYPPFQLSKKIFSKQEKDDGDTKPDEIKDNKNVLLPGQDK